MRSNAIAKQTEGLFANFNSVRTNPMHLLRVASPNYWRAAVAALVACAPFQQRQFFEAPCDVVFKRFIRTGHSLRTPDKDIIMSVLCMKRQYVGSGCPKATFDAISFDG